jgi:hypothetical protein
MRYEWRECIVHEALWRIYRRPSLPAPWKNGGNLPWNDPAFSARMLREHLDQSHGAASRQDPERARQLAWIWQKAGICDQRRRCSISLADRDCTPCRWQNAGLHVTGVDFGPASVAYARELAAAAGVGERCTILERDIRDLDWERGGLVAFDAALLLVRAAGGFSAGDGRADPRRRRANAPPRGQNGNRAAQSGPGGQGKQHLVVHR